MWQQDFQQTLMTWQEVFLGGVGGSLDVLGSPMNELRPLRVPSEKRVTSLMNVLLDKRFRSKFDTSIVFQSFFHTIWYLEVPLTNFQGPRLTNDYLWKSMRLQQYSKFFSVFSDWFFWRNSSNLCCTFKFQQTTLKLGEFLITKKMAVAENPILLYWGIPLKLEFNRSERERERERTANKEVYF